MAFGISREELQQWKLEVEAGQIAYLTHYWLDDRFPGVTTVTKVGCADLTILTAWCRKHGLNPKYIHRRTVYPHFDLVGYKQKEVLLIEEQWEQIQRFNL